MYLLLEVHCVPGEKKQNNGKLFFSGQFWADYYSLLDFEKEMFLQTGEQKKGNQSPRGGETTCYVVMSFSS